MINSQLTPTPITLDESLQKAAKKAGVKNFIKG